MIELLKSAVILIGALILSLAVAVYVMYATGLTLSLLTGGLLGIDTETLAMVFAWTGVVLVSAIFIAIVREVFAKFSEAAKVEMDADELAKMFEDISKGSD